MTTPRVQGQAPNKPSPTPPKPEPKDPNRGPMRSKCIVPSNPSPPPAAHQKKNGLLAFLEQGRSAAGRLFRGRWLRQVTPQIWLWVAGGVPTAITIWVLFATQGGSPRINPSPGNSPPTAPEPLARQSGTVSAPQKAPAPAQSPGNSKSQESVTGASPPDRTMKTAASMGAPGKPNAAPTFFNGTDLAGWEAGCWRVEQGLLVGTVPTSQKALAVLRTTQKYKDFDLRFRVASRREAATARCVFVPSRATDQTRWTMARNASFIGLGRANHIRWAVSRRRRLQTRL